MFSLDIIIVNWNSGPQLTEALASIFINQHNLVSSVIVVDNASTDDSLKQIETFIESQFPLQIIRNSVNRGFASACNQGAKLASNEFLLFMNPDVRLFENALSLPLEFMQRSENYDVGIVGIQLVDEHQQVACSCSRFPSLSIFVAQSLGLNRLWGLRHLTQHMIEWNHGDTRQVDQVIGAFYFVRHELFVSLRGFDERFFIYFEEVDLSLRASKKGWCSVFLSEAKAFHAGGGTSRQVKDYRLFYSLRSRLFYGFKHFSRWQAWMLLSVTLFLEPFTRVVFFLLSGGFENVRYTLRGYIMLYRDLPSILKKTKYP